MKTFFIFILGIIGCFGQVCPTQSVNSGSLNRGLVAWWRFEEGTGTTTLDYTGHGNTGTLSGTTIPTWVVGVYGMALSFDGVSSYVDASSSQFTGLIGNAYTLTLWIKDNTSATTLSSGYHRIISFANGTISIQLGLGTDGLSGGNRVFYIQEATAAVLTAKKNTNPVSLGWHYVSATSDGAGNYHMYLDGVLSDLTPGTYPQSSTYVTNTGLLYIGQRGNGAYVNGLIDDVRIYNRALSDAEVKQLFVNGGSPSGVK